MIVNVKSLEFFNKIMFYYFLLNLSFHSVTSSKIYKIEHFQHPMLHNLTDLIFDDEVQNGIQDPWLVIFYMHTCPYCKMALEAVLKYSNSTNNNMMKLGKVECDENMFLCLRFNITNVPYITIFQNNRFYAASKPLTTEQSLSQFISEERSFDTGKEIPPSFGYINFLFKSFQEAIDYINKTFANLNKYFFKNNFEWTINHTILLLVSILLFIILLEILCFCCCCKPKKKEKMKVSTSNEKDSIDQNKENKDDKLKNE